MCLLVAADGRLVAAGGRLVAGADTAGTAGAGAAGFAGLDADIVLHLLHAGDLLDAVLGEPLHAAIFDGARQHDLAILDRHLDVGGVDVIVVGERLVHALADPLVGSLPVLGALAAVTAHAHAAVGVHAHAPIGVHAAVADHAALAAHAAAITISTLAGFAVERIHPRTHSPPGTAVVLLPAAIRTIGARALRPVATAAAREPVVEPHARAI